MNMLLKTTAAVAMLAGFAAPAFAQTPNGTANVEIVTPLSVSQTATLEFGSLVKPSTGTGTVEIDASSGTQTRSSNVTLAPGAATAPRRGTFAVSGDNNRSFNTTVAGTGENGALVLTRSGGTETIAVALTKSAPTNLTNGSAVVGVGGSFSLASTQAAGGYTGQYTVSVNYN